jgi:hypothetical protein
MKPNNSVDAYIIPELLRHDPETGKLYWKSRPIELFSELGRGGQKGNAARWNRRNAGKEAFTAISTAGYRVGFIFKRHWLAHRVIWCLTYGEWPEDEIDHINGDRQDNRIENLRSVNTQENNRNRCIQKDNTSGIAGVSWMKNANKWQVRIGLVHIGLFATIEEASEARKQAEYDHGYHENHGRAA